MNNENLYVDKEIYYHIENGVYWNLGETRTIGLEKNNYMKYHDITSYVKEDPNTNINYCISYIADGMIEYINTNHKPDYLKSFYHFDANETVKELSGVLNDYLVIVREFVFEEVRREFYSNLPSRQRCMWVIPDNKDSLRYWWNMLKQKGQIVKLELTGKLFQTNHRDLLLTTNSLDYVRMQANRYWSPLEEINMVEDECLFEGAATAIEILNPIKLGL